VRTAIGHFVAIALGVLVLTALVVGHPASDYRLVTRGSTFNRVAVIGDSYTNGTKIGGRGANSWPALAWGILARQGIQVDADVAAEGKAGYGVRGDQGNLFSDLTVRAVKGDDALVVFFGSINDQPVDPMLYPTLVAENLQIVRQVAPRARILVIGPPWPTADPPGQLFAIRDSLRDQAWAAGAVFIDPLAEGWFVGRPDLIGQDGVHPNNAGHQYMAHRIAPLIHDQLAVPV
jgi:lysophospholipase L1-like esterase